MDPPATPDSSDPNRSVVTATGRHLALIGLMGVGKSTVGRVLAARLGRRFFDNDELVSDLGRPDVATVTRDDGEAAMRSLEADVLRQQLAAPEPAVLSVAAGTVVSAENRRLLDEACVVVWLTAPVSLLAARVTSSEQGRPFIRGDAAAVLGRQLDERSGWYAELADVVVDVAGRSPDAIADAVLAGLESR
jgi:shikimate kinase